jgi:Na+:H+ antiporter, NhaA family
MTHSVDTASQGKTPLSPIQQFIHSESFGGILLLTAALLAFIIANSPWNPQYQSLLSTKLGFTFGSVSLYKPALLWVNDGLMAVFFLLVGLEIKRELLIGELSRFKDAALSVFAALGGMVVPALIYVSFTWGTDGIRGWGIPMATDIAFALGVISLLGRRVPLSLKVFLTALAIVDDLGAVLVIAIFYTEKLKITMLLISLLLLGASWFYGRLGGRKLSIFLFIGLIAWFFMLKSGIHATIAGVLLAFTIPMRRPQDSQPSEAILHSIRQSDSLEEVEVKVEQAQHLLAKSHSPLHQLEHALHGLVAFAIMPIFAFYNAGVPLSGDIQIASSVSLGCAFGLLIGKPLGIVLFSWVSSQLGLSSLPAGIRWIHILAVGFLAGIGFTMSFFIANLAFPGSILLNEAKVGIMGTSVVCALTGLCLLYSVTKNPESANT